MMVKADDEGVVFMRKVGDKRYAVYKRDDLSMNTDFLCDTKSLLAKSTDGLASKPANRVLRKFRLAVSAAGEYTQYHGGTVADAMAAINETMTVVNQIYETDLGISMELVANNEDVIYTNAASDPYSGNWNTEVQTTLTSVIGAQNYDIGHLFQRAQNGGNAGFVGSVCIDNRKEVPIRRE